MIQFNAQQKGLIWY